MESSTQTLSTSHRKHLSTVRVRVLLFSNVLKLEYEYSKIGTKVLVYFEYSIPEAMFAIK